MDGFELGIERYIAASPERVWEAWTGRLAEWWAPKPWATRILENDLRPGGRSALEMTGPNGETPPIMEGVYLEVVPHRSIVVTNAFTVGWMPQAPFMVALFGFAPEGAGTRYTARSRHWDEETMKQHEAMGFHQGWAIVADQLAAIAEAD